MRVSISQLIENDKGDAETERIDKKNIGVVFQKPQPPTARYATEGQSFRALSSWDISAQSSM